MKTIVGILILATILSSIATVEIQRSKQKDHLSITKLGLLDSLHLSNSIAIKWNELKKSFLNIYEMLNTRLVKNRKDICVWKVCSRPLKLRNQKAEKSGKKEPQTKVFKKGFKLGSVFI